VGEKDFVSFFSPFALCCCVFFSYFSSNCVVLCFALCVLCCSCFVLLQALVLCCFSFYFFSPPHPSLFFLFRVIFLLIPSFLLFLLPCYFCLASPLLFGALHFVGCFTLVVCWFTFMLVTLLFCVPCM